MRISNTSIILEVFTIIYLLSHSTGIHGLAEKLNSNLETGLVPGDFDDRTEEFGSNFKAVTKRTPFCKLFIGAMEDFMLRILLVCAVVSIIFGEAFATD